MLRFFRTRAINDNDFPGKAWMSSANLQFAFKMHLLCRRLRRWWGTACAWFSRARARAYSHGRSCARIPTCASSLSLSLPPTAVHTHTHIHIRVRVRDCAVVPRTWELARCVYWKHSGLRYSGEFQSLL